MNCFVLKICGKLIPENIYIFYKIVGLFYVKICGKLISRKYYILFGENIHFIIVTFYDYLHRELIL